jgi:hypothetical protein
MKRLYLISLILFSSITLFSQDTLPGPKGIGIASPSAMLHVATSGGHINAVNQYNGDVIIHANPGSRSPIWGASLELLYQLIPMIVIPWDK